MAPLGSPGELAQRYERSTPVQWARHRLVTCSIRVFLSKSYFLAILFIYDFVSSFNARHFTARVLGFDAFLYVTLHTSINTLKVIFLCRQKRFGLTILAM